MLIKKRMSGALWPMLCLSLAATVNIAHADTTPVKGLTQTLTIDGEVTSGSCDVDFPATITFADQDITELKDAAHAGSYNSLTPPTTQPNIVLSACSPQQMFTVKLIGTADSKDTTALANDATDDPAHDVAMRAFVGDLSDSAQLKPNVASKVYNADANGNMTLPFWPGLLKTDDSVTPGNVHVTGQIQIDYL
ncbi:hypothetical protein GJV04_14435 [Enterobacteriaceae bacterium RIT714]|nr:hypothetical protein [Enterobacteriaceae bacterium RIT714]